MGLQQRGKDLICSEICKYVQAAGFCLLLFSDVDHNGKSESDSSFRKVSDLSVF